jgi:sugar phosphate isomerase/epimerase
VIYVSSACVRADTIKEAIVTLAEEGFKGIELSGTTRYYPGLEDDLLWLRDKYELSYLIHNYFPPPQKPFILNLASLDDGAYGQSLQLCRNAISLSKILGCRKYGVHAGYLVDFSPEEAGGEISFRHMNDRQKAMNRFCDAWNTLTCEADSAVELYIENNVISKTNLITYQGNNPFLFTDYEGYLEIKAQIDCKILLDVAHLKVSSNSLALAFEGQVKAMLPLTDYIHISGNDGQHDQNLGLEGDTAIINVLSRYDLSGKSITLEVYDGISSIVKSLEALRRWISSKSQPVSEGIRK